MGRGKRREPLFSLSPSHRAPRALFFFLPSLPTTQRGLYGEERQLTHMQPSTWPVPNACAKPYHPGVGQLSRHMGKCTPTNQSAWYSPSDQKTADPSSWNRFCSISLKGLQMLGQWIAFTFKIVLRLLSMHEPHFAFQEAHMGFSTHLPHCAGFITQLLVTVESP